MLRKHFVHGELLKTKALIDPDIAEIYKKYLEFLQRISELKIVDDSSIVELMNHFNTYRNEVIYTLESRKNSGQENFRSSMLEELFCHLFTDLVAEILPIVPKNLFMGKANAYVDLTFSPSSFSQIFSKPNPYIHSKDQDFVLGTSLEIIIRTEDDSTSKRIVVPVVAIECKTYIERNMLDSCSGTARRLKNAMPYCIYIVAAEYMKLRDEQPELSEINEIYILCKASISERSGYKKQSSPVHKIHEDLIIDLYRKVKGHLNSIWWAPDNALVTGKIINRP